MKFVDGCKVLHGTLVELKAAWLQNLKEHKNIVASQKTCTFSMYISMYDDDKYFISSSRLENKTLEKPNHHEPKNKYDIFRSVKLDRSRIIKKCKKKYIYIYIYIYSFT